MQQMLEYHLIFLGVSKQAISFIYLPSQREVKQFLNENGMQYNNIITPYAKVLLSRNE